MAASKKLKFLEVSNNQLGLCEKSCLDTQSPAAVFQKEEKNV